MLKKKQKRFKPLITLIITFIIIGLVLLVLWLFSNKTIYTPDKVSIENYTKQTIDHIETLSNPVYKKIVDTGCHEGDIGWLGTHYSCSFKAKIFFKDKGDAEANLTRLNGILTARNFKPKNQVFPGKQTESYEYAPAKGIVVYMRIFRPDNRPLTAAQELQLDTELDVAPDEYVYGVNISAVYWSCSDNSWLQANCPTPPTPAIRS